MNPNAPPEWLAALFIPFFVGMWVSVCFLLSLIGGWRKLARRYRSPGAIEGTKWRNQSAELRGYFKSSYGNCLTVVANEAGLGVSILFLFRVGHPPLFIPWTEISVNQETRFFFFKGVRLTFSSEPSVSIWILNRLAIKIQAAVGQDWFEENRVETA